MEKETVGIRILLQRKKAELNQTQLSKLVYVGKSTISIWENDDAEPKLSQFKDLAKALNCTSNYLMGIAEGEEMSSTSYSQSIHYRKFTHEWKIVRDIMLLIVITSGITTVTLKSELWFTISVVAIIVYVVSVLIMEMVDVKNEGPDINYPIGEKLIYIHQSELEDIRKLNSTHKSSMALQLFMIFFSFITLLNITNGKLTNAESIYIVFLGLFLIGWTIFMFVEIIRRSYMSKEVEHSGIRKRFGHYLYEMNLFLALMYFISNLVPYYLYNYEINDVLLNFMSIVIPGMYVFLTWAIQFGLSKFYAKFKLHSYNKDTDLYTCLEEVE